MSKQEQKTIEDIRIELIELTLEMIKKYPSDTELGKWVRDNFNYYFPPDE